MMISILKTWLSVAVTQAGGEPEATPDADGAASLFNKAEDLQKTTQASQLPAIDSSWLRDLMPDVLKGVEAFGLEYWQWIGLFLLILGGLALDLTVRLICRMIAVRVIKRQDKQADTKDVAYTVRPIGLLAAALFWLTVFHLLGLQGIAFTILSGAAKVFAVLAGTWAAWRVTDLLTKVLGDKAKKTETKLDDILVPLLRKSLKVFIFIFAVLYGAASLNIELAPLLASLGIGGLAFAFAAKDTIENFFGSIAVLVDRPFTVGDWVNIDGVDGTVEDLGFRSTRIRTFYNSLITMPNSKLVRAVVDNYGSRRYRRWKETIGIQYDTPPDKIVAFCEGIRELIRVHPFTRKDYFHVYMNTFGPSSLNILLYVFFQVPDWSMELRERERLFLDIVRLADRLGVQFAFPTTTVHLYQENHEAPHMPSDIPDKNEVTHSQTQGIVTAQELVANQPWRAERPGPVRFSFGPTPIEEPKGDDGE